MSPHLILPHQYLQHTTHTILLLVEPQANDGHREAIAKSGVLSLLTAATVSDLTAAVDLSHGAQSSLCSQRGYCHTMQHAAYLLHSGGQRQEVHKNQTLAASVL